MANPTDYVVFYFLPSSEKLTALMWVQARSGTPHAILIDWPSGEARHEFSCKLEILFIKRISSPKTQALSWKWARVGVKKFLCGKSSATFEVRGEENVQLLKCRCQTFKGSRQSIWTHFTCAWVYFPQRFYDSKYYFRSRHWPFLEHLVFLWIHLTVWKVFPMCDEDYMDQNLLAQSF